MIKEVIVVEGKQDIAAVRRAVDAECVATGGFGLGKTVLERLEYANAKRGLIIFTDPDSAGERIRKFLSRRFPDARHAFVPREQATANNDIGVEQASPDAIREALGKVRLHEWKPSQEFAWTDVIREGLTGADDAAGRRAELGRILGIGYANAKGFLQRLNHYGVTRREFEAALAELAKKCEIKEQAKE